LFSIKKFDHVWTWCKLNRRDKNGTIYYMVTIVSGISNGYNQT